MEIKISRCATRCHGCEHDFVHEQKVYSMAKIEEEALVRLDYCESCRPQKKDATLFCLWETRYSDPKVLDAEHQETLTPLRRLFYDLAESNTRLDLAQAFLAAQLLKRQRAFRQIRESEEGDGEVRTTLYLDRSGNRLIETRDLNFSYSELDEARQALLEHLRALEVPESQSDSDADAAANADLTVTEPDVPESSETPVSKEGETTP